MAFEPLVLGVSLLVGRRSEDPSYESRPAHTNPLHEISLNLPALNLTAFRLSKLGQSEGVFLARWHGPSLEPEVLHLKDISSEVSNLQRLV